MPSLGSTSLVANNDVMAKIWTNTRRIQIQLSAWVENIVGKGEIARYEQFLLFPQCFQKQSVVDVLKWVTAFQTMKVGHCPLESIYS